MNGFVLYFDISNNVGVGIWYSCLERSNFFPPESHKWCETQSNQMTEAGGLSRLCCNHMDYCNNYLHPVLESDNKQERIYVRASGKT